MAVARDRSCNLCLQSRAFQTLIRVTHYQRKPAPGFHSIERVFGDIRKRLPPQFHVGVATSRYPSRGLFRRLYNAVEAVFRQGQVNHVTGDTHYLACFLSARKTVLTIHDCVMMTRLAGIRRWLYWFFWLWLPVRRSARVTVVSEATRREVFRYVKCSPDKLRVICNGVSDEFVFAPRELNGPEATILQIGTGPNKNLKNVIRALDGLRCSLVIMGEPTVRQTELLRLHGVKHTVVSNLSPEEVTEQYLKCDVVVFASTYEGFGLPILEANAIGRAVITSNRLPMSEVSGDAACLVDPDDVTSIRGGIEKVLGDAVYRNELITNGVRNAQKFSVASAADQYEALYRELAD